MHCAVHRCMALVDSAGSFLRCIFALGLEESPTSWLLPISCDQPLRLRRSINCTTIDEIMKDRSTRQVGPFSQASNFRLGQVRQSS